uniref:Transmembrane protein n=1 Tax=Neospora caninum (strain Liverpool) TaxID=572307 RepID=A0A0F7UCS1_NEOCL|nr:TPA: hypothetical protein BN1204_034595 [Neospora caninum Liverpool]
MDTHVHSTSPPTLLPQERLDHLSRSPLPLQNSSIVHGASGALPQASSFPSSFSSYYPHSSFPSSSFPSSSCPPAPASPSPLTLRDFLQLLGESVAVLEGLRLLLLQLLQWGGEVGSVVRASTFLHKLLAFLFRVLRLLLSPLSAAFHLLASPRHAKREEGDGRNRERIPPPLGNRGPRSLGAVDRGTLADAEPYSASLVNTFHNAWRSAREGAQTAGGTYPISLGWSAPGFAEDKALRVAPHLHGKPGSHLQASASKPIPEKGLLSRLRGQTSWAALARVWRGRRGVVIYAAIVFGLACKLRSLWKKYRYVTWRPRSRKGDRRKWKERERHGSQRLWNHAGRSR